MRLGVGLRGWDGFRPHVVAGVQNPLFVPEELEGARRGNYTCTEIMYFADHPVQASPG